MSDNLREIGQSVQPDEPGAESLDVVEVESFLIQTQQTQDGEPVQGEQVQGEQSQGGKVSGLPRQPYLLGGTVATIVLPASLLAAVWLQRRRVRPTIAAPTEIAGRLGTTRFNRMALGRGSSRGRAKQTRMTRLANQTQMQARTLGTQVRAKAGRVKQPQEISPWEAAGEQIQSNRMSLAALALAFSLLGVGRWLDEQERHRKGN